MTRIRALAALLGLLVLLVGCGDLRPSTPVVVQDSSGHRVAAGTLGGGRMMLDLARMKPGGSAAGVTQGCQLGFAVQGVPPVGRDWSLRVGRRQFPLDASRATNLRLTLG